MGGLIRRRGLIEPTAEGSAPYIIGTSGDYIDLPIPWTKVGIIRIVGYLEHPAPSSGSYNYFVTWGATSSGLGWKGGIQAFWYVRNGYNGTLLTAHSRTIPALEVVWNASTVTLTVTFNDGVTLTGSQGGYDTTSRPDLRMRLMDGMYYQQIQYTDTNGVLQYDLVATQDGNGVACMYDQVNNNYYYSANGTATLVNSI